MGKYERIYEVIIIQNEPFKNLKLIFLINFNYFLLIKYNNY